MTVGLAGQIIRGYELRELVSQNEIGVIYYAHQPSLDREVAIKIIQPQTANHPTFIRHFEAEAQLVARLEHFHIVPLYDFWREPDGAYLVMRWLRGGSLRNQLQRAPLNMDGLSRVVNQVAAALMAAHRHNIIHRNLKPENILFDEDDNAYLSDFGIANDLSQSSMRSSVYFSPEQINGEALTPQSDIFSLGVVLYEALTGEHPFPNMPASMHINEPLPDLTGIRPDLPSGLNGIIQRATAPAASERYVSALAIASDFHDQIALPESAAVDDLTEREAEILRLIANGLTNRAIADRLVLALSTVKWYVRQIYNKLNVSSRTQAVARARQLNLLTGRAVTRGEAVTTLNTPQLENPYKGLRAFQSADHQDFFGRERLIDKLVEVEEQTRFLAIIGPSGSGKSSLVNAGLIPALKQGALPESEKWFIVNMLPGARPLDELEVALSRIATAHADQFYDHLHRDVFGLVRVAKLILPDDGSELVLVIDQFEELFTLTEDENIRRHFLGLLCNAVTPPHSRVRVIVTLRADFYDRPLQYPAFGEILCNSMETLLPLSAEELERAIVRPAQGIGVHFEEGLVSTIIGDVNDQPGFLPLLQYALTELFEGREGNMLTHEAYRAIGGTVGALARRIDQVYLDLDEKGQEFTRQMFLRLVSLGEGVEDTRRRVARAELMAIADDKEHADDIIDAFTAHRLLSLDHDFSSRHPVVEVAHEAILREWTRLRQWLNESRDAIRLQRQLAHAAGEWQNAQQDPSFLLRGSRLEIFENWAAETQLALTEKERGYLSVSISVREKEHQAEQERQAHEIRLERRARRFLRGLVAVLLLATLGALGLTGEAVHQRNIAQDNEAEARSLALASSAQLALNESNIDQAIQLAQAALGINSENQLARNVLALAISAPPSPSIFQETEGYVPSALSPGETDLRFALVAHMPAEGFFFSEIMVKGMEDACELLQASCLWFGGWGAGWDDFLPYWDEALAYNPDGIGSTIPNLTPAIRERAELATNQGIPVVAFNVARDRDPISTERSDLYIGSNEFTSGESNARRVFAQARADGVTIERGVCVNQFNDNGPGFMVARCAGVENIFAIEGVPLDKISFGNEDGTEAEATVLTDGLADYFAAHLETNAVFMLGPGPAVSLRMYFEQAGIEPGDIYATTHDTSPEAFQMIREGYLLQTIDQQPYMQAFQTIISLYLYHQYGVRPSGFINTSSVVDRSNVDNVVQLVEMGYR